MSIFKREKSRKPLARTFWQMSIETLASVKDPETLSEASWKELISPYLYENLNFGLFLLGNIKLQTGLHYLIAAQILDDMKEYELEYIILEQFCELRKTNSLDFREEESYQAARKTMFGLVADDDTKFSDAKSKWKTLGSVARELTLESKNLFSQTIYVRSSAKRGSWKNNSRRFNMPNTKVALGDSNESN